MIVIGVDPHKETHSAAVVEQTTAQLLDDRTAVARQDGFDELPDWARALDAERKWGLEDGRHVSGGLERFLLAPAEHVVRVPPKLMARERKAVRQFGKSDPIDALATARAAIRERDLPVARPAGRSVTSRCCPIIATFVVLDATRDVAQAPLAAA